MADDVDRRVALGTTILGAAAFVLLATWLVPWQAMPGGLPAPVAADSVFSPAQIERAEDYARWARVWGWSGLIVSVAVACWLGFTDVGRRLTDRLPGRWWVQVVLAVTALTLIGRVATLPFSIAYRRLQLDAGLSSASWPVWAFDLVKGELVTIVATSLALLAMLGIARRWPRTWTAAAGGALAVFVVLASFVYPVLVEPLFNSFTPLEDGRLRTEVLELAAEEGVEVDEVLVADASRRTTTLNAYVSGFGGTRRVVLYDTLVEDVPRDQALSVVAHELAHARHDDVLTGTALGAAGAMFGVGLLGLLMTGTAQRRGRPRVGEVGSVPMILALAALAAVLASPVENGISRRIEVRADVEALAATDDPRAFAGLQRRLAIRSLADPNPPAWSHWWFGSHPTVLQRIALARAFVPDAFGALEGDDVQGGDRSAESGERADDRERDQ